MILAKDQIGDESMMDVAERYLRELEERSLVQVVVDDDRTRMTRFKYCHLHDLVRDMSLEMAEEENFFSLIHSQNGFDDEVYKFSSLTNKIHRLVIHLEKDVPKYIPPTKRTTRHLRSLKLVVDIEDYEEPITRTIHSQIIQFEMLRSLEIMVPSFPEGKSFQNAFGRWCLRSIDSHKLSMAIGNLIHLRYLSLGGYLMFQLPSSIGNLKQLQTLDLRDLRFPHIPNTMWKLTQLKHLYLPITSWETSAPEKLRFDGLNKLEILEGFDSRYCCFEDLVKLTNLRRLEARLHIGDDNLDLIYLLYSKSSIKMDLTILSSEKDDEKIDLTRLLSDGDYEVGFVQMRSTDLSKLFSCEKILKLEVNISIDSLPDYKIGLASHLIDLTLNDSMLQGDPMQLLGKLSNLKYLALGRKCFVGTKMNFHSGSFLQLRRRQFWYLPDLKELKIAEGAMPNLLVLQIFSCEELEMIPDGLIFIKTLIKLQVEFMPESFIRRIQVIDGQEGEDYYKIGHVPTIKVDSFKDELF